MSTPAPLACGMPASAPDVHELECYFYKRCSTSKHRWQRRLFRLDGRALSYFDDPSSSENKAAKKRALWLHKVQFVRERAPKSGSVGGGGGSAAAYFLDIGYGDRLFTLRDQTDEHLLVWAEELRSRREAVLTELRKNDATASRPEAGEVEEDVRSERSALTVSSWLDSESAAASAAGKSSADDVGTATTEDDRVSVVSTPSVVSSCRAARAGAAAGQSALLGSSSTAPPLNDSAAATRPSRLNPPSRGTSRCPSDADSAVQQFAFFSRCSSSEDGELRAPSGGELLSRCPSDAESSNASRTFEDGCASSSSSSRSRSPRRAESLEKALNRMWAGAAESCAGGRAGFLGDRLVARMETWVEAEFARQAQTRRIALFVQRTSCNTSTEGSSSCSTPSVSLGVASEDVENNYGVMPRFTRSKIWLDVLRWAVSAVDVADGEVEVEVEAKTIERVEQFLLHGFEVSLAEELKQRASATSCAVGEKDATSAPRAAVPSSGDAATTQDSTFPDLLSLEERAHCLESVFCKEMRSRVVGAAHMSRLARTVADDVTSALNLGRELSVRRGGILRHVGYALCAFFNFLLGRYRHFGNDCAAGTASCNAASSAGRGASTRLAANMRRSLAALQQSGARVKSRIARRASNPAGPGDRSGVTAGDTETTSSASSTRLSDIGVFVSLAESLATRSFRKEADLQQSFFDFHARFFALCVEAAFPVLEPLLQRTKPLRNNLWASSRATSDVDSDTNTCGGRAGAFLLLLVAAHDFLKRELVAGTKESSQKVALASSWSYRGLVCALVQHVLIRPSIKGLLRNAPLRRLERFFLGAPDSGVGNGGSYLSTAPQLLLRDEMLLSRIVAEVDGSGTAKNLFNAHSGLEALTLLRHLLEADDVGVAYVDVRQKFPAFTPVLAKRVLSWRGELSKAECGVAMKEIGALEAALAAGTATSASRLEEENKTAPVHVVRNAVDVFDGILA